jgi:hypothetical protein
LLPLRRLAVIAGATDCLRHLRLFELAGHGYNRNPPAQIWHTFLDLARALPRPVVFAVPRGTHSLIRGALRIA